MNMLTRQLDAQGRALGLLAQRQQVLAANIANSDTPGWRARDLDFAAALAAQNPGSHLNSGAAIPGHTRHLALTAPGHLGANLAAASPGLMYRGAEQASLDGNTVDMDRERANFADNATRYEATLRFINSHVRTMLSAITGQ